MEDDSTGAGVTVTLKFDKGYEAPWLVLRGSPALIRGQLCEALGWDASTKTESTLTQLVADASSQVQAEYRVMNSPTRGGLGGSVIQKGATPSAPPSAPPGDGGGDAVLLGLIRDAKSEGDLKKLVAAYGDAIRASDQLTNEFRKKKADLGLS